MTADIIPHPAFRPDPNGQLSLPGSWAWPRTPILDDLYRRVADALTDPEIAGPKIEAVARQLRRLWVEPIIDSGDAADCLQALICGLSDEMEIEIKLLDELSRLLYRAPLIMLEGPKL